MYLCSETPGKSGELGRLAGGRRVDAGKGEGKAVDEAEVKAGVVAEAWTTLATREEEMVVLIPEALEGGGVGAVGVEVEDGLRVTAVGEGGEVGGVQEEAVEGEVVTVLTLL